MTENKSDPSNMPIVACVTVGMFEENCYLYACPKTREAVIIDPGDEAQRIGLAAAPMRIKVTPVPPLAGRFL